MSDGIGVENVDTKVGTTQLFGLPEKGEVAVAGAEDEKPAPEAAKNPQSTSLLKLQGQIIISITTCDYLGFWLNVSLFLKVYTCHICYS